jgi:peptidoglycan/xylan/chitin deacetylase (PgdA/CDA1 family)
MAQATLRADAPTRDWRHRIFAAGFSAIAATRADRWLAPFAQGAGVILTLHHVRPAQRRSFSPNGFLEITPEFLETMIATTRRAGFEFIGIDEVPERLISPARRRPFAVLTFDDGYRDNLEHAWPILRRNEVPWTVYVVPDFLNGSGRLWWVELEQAIAQREQIALQLGPETIGLSIRTIAEKQAAYRLVERRWRTASPAEQRAGLASLAAMSESGPELLTRSLCAGWAEIAELARDPLVTIGAHTMSHPVLSRLGEEDALREMRTSRIVIEDRLRRPVVHLAYPHGDRVAIGEREHRLAAAAGFETAVTTRPGHLQRWHVNAPHALPRISMNGLHQNESALRALLSGAPFLASGIKRR